MSAADALVHLDDAIAALTMDGFVVPASLTHCDAPVARVPQLQLTVADDLERIDAAIGPKGKSVLWPIAQEIKRAIVEIEAARLALGRAPSTEPAA